MERELGSIIYFSKIQFEEILMGKIYARILLSIPQVELSYQKFNCGKLDVKKSIAIKLSDSEMIDLLPLCNALDFEKYRSKEMSMDDIGVIGYRDETSVSFIGITDSYISMIKLPMDLIYNEKNMWPHERLYQYLVNKFFKMK